MIVTPIINSLSSQIFTVKLLPKGLTDFQANELYIGKLSDLPARIARETNNINLLCIAGGDDKPETIPEPILRNKSLNLLLVDNRMDLADLLNEAQDILAANQYLLRSSSLLLNSVINEKGLQNIIDTAYEILGNPITLTDSSFKLLASTKDPEIDDPVWNDLLIHGYFSYDNIQLFKVGKFIEKAAESTAPYIIDTDFAEKHRRITAKITIGEKVVGYFAVLELDRQFNSIDFDLVSLICKVISSEMQKFRYIHDAKDSAYESLIIDILDGNPASPDVIWERYKSFEYETDKNFCVLSVNIDEYDHTHSLIPYVMNCLEKMISGAKAVAYGNQIVIILKFLEKKQLGEDKLQALAEFLRINKMYAGLSQCFDSIPHLQKYYRQSVACMKIGRKVNKEEVLYKYDDYAIYLMINLCGKYQDITDFCHPALFRLIDYDSKNNTNFVETLHAYIINAKNLSSAAGSLFIHRNTMSYRIAKIQEIIDLDLNNDKQLTNLLISYKILEYDDKIPK